MARILIVDEGPINRRFVATLLRNHGHEPFEASTGAEALEIVRTRRPELVLIDTLMQQSGGYQFVLDLRSQRDLPQPLVMFRSDPYIEDEARALARAAGASYAVKPSSPEVLLALVDAALREPAPQPGERDPERSSVDAFLHPILSKLHHQLRSLERINAQQDRRVVESSAQCEAARSALDVEIKKRLWAERELTQANSHLRDQAMRDALTGLYNRRYLEESLEREESRARRSGQPIAVMMIDIDHFKQFNDTLGHAAGDAVLRAVGRCMDSLSRGEDILSRFGGDEFVLVMAQTSQSTARERAEAIRSGVQQLEIECDGERVGPVTLSGGIGMFPFHGESGRAVLLVADAALNHAKKLGRNRVMMGEGVKH